MSKLYFKRLIDSYLVEWAGQEIHKPVLLRGARQVGKSTAVRHLGEQFESYVEINFERQPEFKSIFKENFVISRIVSQLSAMCGIAIEEG